MAVQYLRIQVRRDSKANWSTANPVLLLGEVGYETDTKRTKTGDGALSWSNLPYDKAGIVAVGEGLAVDEDGVLTNNYDHSDDLGDLGGQTVKAYVDAQDAATLESAKSHSDAVSSGKADKIELEAEVTTLENLIADETNARQVNDNNLQGQINANYTEFTTYTGTAGQRLTSLEADATNQTAVDAGDALTLASANLNASDALTAAVTTLEAKDAAQDPLIAAAQTAADDAQADATANAGRLDVLENVDPTTAGSVAEAKKAGDDAQATADANALAIANKANSSEVYSTGQVYTKSETDGLFDSLLANDNIGPDHAWTGQNSFSQTITGDISGNAGSANVASDSAPGSTLEGALSNRVVKGEFTALSTTLASDATDPATIAAALVQLVSDLNDIGA